MKKILFFAVVASVALAGCTRNESVKFETPDTPISFSPFSLRNATKAAGVYGEIGTYYNTSESFAAWAYFTKDAKATVNPQTNADASNGSEFFGTSSAGITCTYNSTGKYWEPTPNSYYWPRAGYLHFHALSPSDVENGTVAHSWANGFTITGYVAKAYSDANTAEDLTDDIQIDLLYSDFIFDRQRSAYTPQTGLPYDDDDNQTGAASGTSDYAYNGVDITFNHALAAIKFKAKTDANYLTGTQQHKFIVRKIEILNAYNTGNFHENRANTADNVFAALPANAIGKTQANTVGDLTPYWDTFSNEVTITPYDATAGTGVEASYVASYDPTSATPAAIGKLALVLPQALDHTAAGGNKVQIRVTYDYWFSNDSGTSWIKYEGVNALQSILDIAGYEGKYNYTSGTPTPDYTVNNWLINHKYTYVLNFKLDKIIFDPKVEAWVEVENIGVDLPAQN